jgi:spermidine dehydrogenase
MSITRRDFLNGVALNIAAGLTPAAQLAAQPSRYPPALTGLRGEHQGSFETAHALAREGRSFPFDPAPIEEPYDLVVVGGGISGLSAAWFYRRARPSARILILDNHDDFGGHAKRNEFTLDGRRIIGYGGSQSLQSPNWLYSPVAKSLIRDLGVDTARFETAFERDFYPSLGLSRGTFFHREAFGRDVLVTGDPGGGSARPNTKPIAQFVAGFPISKAGKAQIVALYAGTSDPLAGKSQDAKREILKRTSYRDYLTKICGCGEEVANCFQGHPLGFFGLGSDAVPAADARDLGYPGFAGLKLTSDTSPAWQEPYIYHFPDGNASIARLLVRSLIPSAAPGDTMEDIVSAGFDYGALDHTGEPVRIRLDSTCVHVGREGGKAQIAYVRDGALHRVEARHAVLACFHMMPRTCRRLSGRLWRRTSRPRSATPTSWCETGRRS